MLMIIPMKKKIRAISLMQEFRHVLLLCMAAVFFGTPFQGQEIHIRVLNARKGKPITNECLNVWVGPLHGAGLFAPTNHDGVVVLHLGNDQVTADAVSPAACNGRAVVGPKLILKDADAITITGGNYVDCQEYGKIVPGDAANPNLVRQLWPLYSIKKILESGISAPNMCGKFRAEAKPGELVIFERPATLWERLRQ